MTKMKLIMKKEVMKEILNHLPNVPREHPVHAISE